MNRTAALLFACGLGCGNDRAPARPDALPNDAAADAAIDAPLADPITLELSGAISPVHDPVVTSVDGVYLLLSTGEGITRRTSIDLHNWSLGGQIFAAKPDWITTTDPGRPNELWAPDLTFFNGTYHLYFSASRFGSNVSCIGHASAQDPIANVWIDHGPLICSTASDNWNAIDPAAFVDADGNHWLAFGSFWGGLKLIPLAADGSRSGTEMVALSTRADTAVEAPFLVHEAGFYYLFESVGNCCQGVASTYKVLVGRSANIRGPYVDTEGTPLLNGGGTLVVEGGARFRGPGHNAVLRTAGGDYNIYHSYDANAGGAPTLRISEMRWTAADGWPISAAP